MPVVLSSRPTVNRATASGSRADGILESPAPSSSPSSSDYHRGGTARVSTPRRSPSFSCTEETFRRVRGLESAESMDSHPHPSFHHGRCSGSEHRLAGVVQRFGEPLMIYEWNAPSPSRSEPGPCRPLVVRLRISPAGLSWPTWARCRGGVSVRERDARQAIRGIANAVKEAGLARVSRSEHV